MTKKVVVGILNYGVGNIRSLANVLRKLNFSIMLVETEDCMKECHVLILPGVGAASYAMSKLRQSGLDECIKQRYEAGKVCLIGICLGMQLFFDHSEEGDVSCLGLLPGSVIALPNGNCHVGWNSVYPENNWGCLRKTEAFYFNHSYFFSSHSQCVTAKTKEQVYIPAIVQKESLVGFQFHPEKSQRAGKRLLEETIAGFDL
jgi:glutamine amidotransferase